MLEKSSFLIQIYQKFVRLLSSFQSIFLLIIRIIWGYQFFLSGWNKVGDIPGFARFLESLDIWAPVFHAYFVSYAEMILGLFLLFGLFSRPSALVLTIIMFTAYSTAHTDSFTLSLFKDPSIFAKETPFAYLFTSLIVLLFGPGLFSIDGWARRLIHYKEKYPY
ncbi:MAG: DoxX family protein [Chlamydiota bacterium]